MSPSTSYHHHDAFTVTSTSFREFLRSPVHYYHRYVLGDAPKESTAATTYGSALHCMALEPHEFAKSFYVDKFRGGSKDSKKLAEEMEGKERITVHDFEEIKYLSRLLRENEYCRNELYTSEAIYETPVELKLGEITVKCKPDALTPTAIIDLKTFGHNRYEFCEHAAKLGYQVQGAFYGGIIALSSREDHRDFVMIVISKRKPFDIFPIVLPQGELAHCWEKVCRPGLKALEECLFSNCWDKYNSVEERRWTLRKKDC
jgi:hypothetical protein